MEKKKNILIIDGDLDCRAELEKALRKGDYNITASKDGHELFDKQRKLPIPDLVITEILELRPGIDTFSLIRTFKSSGKTKRTKIIVASSSQEAKDRDV